MRYRDLEPPAIGGQAPGLRGRRRGPTRMGKVDAPVPGLRAAPDPGTSADRVVRDPSVSLHAAVLSERRNGTKSAIRQTAGPQTRRRIWAWPFRKAGRTCGPGPKLRAGQARTRQARPPRIRARLRFSDAQRLALHRPPSPARLAPFCAGPEPFRRLAVRRERTGALRPDARAVRDRSCPQDPFRDLGVPGRQAKEPPGRGGAARVPVAPGHAAVPRRACHEGRPGRAPQRAPPDHDRRGARSPGR